MSEYSRRLTDEEAMGVVNGKYLAYLSNGYILENPSLFSDKLPNGQPTQSLQGSVGKLKYSWPACGCGVRTLIRVQPNPRAI